MNINFQHDSIWGYDPSTWEGIDRPASEAKLIELVNKEYQRLGIDAELTISNNTSSRLSDMNDDAVNEAIYIADEVWGEHQWYVEIQQ